ncbi:MAG TPA: 4-hydroxy-tetrahydrodipicolinate reductase [Xanthomonadaceae bacterium]|nr:4-hydroxy-tetrahydrodipicolinate reductase [Xanthomonadaceae bacterium]
MRTVKIAVHGATGRMGLAVLRAVMDASDVEVAAALVRPGSQFDGEPVEKLLGRSGPHLEFSSVLDPDLHLDVLVDFTVAQSFDAGLALARARGCAFVSGTTGLDAAQQSSLDAAAESIAVLWASNFSLGVAVMCRLAAHAARALGRGFDAEIVELHHRHKQDAPSGTALTLAEVVAAARGRSIDTVGRFARHGHAGPRAEDEIGVLALRGGDAIGEHSVLFLGDGERLELSHRVSDRGIFARGAVAAARWISGRSAGRYDMADLFG